MTLAVSQRSSRLGSFFDQLKAFNGFQLREDAIETFWRVNRADIETIVGEWIHENEMGYWRPQVSSSETAQKKLLDLAINYADDLNITSPMAFRNFRILIKTMIWESSEEVLRDIQFDKDIASVDDAIEDVWRNNRVALKALMDSYTLTELYTR